MTRPALLDEAVINEWLAGHPAWRMESGHLVREVATDDYPSAVRLVAEQVTLAEELDHHPIITLGYRDVRFEVWTHDRGGLTHLDVEYAAGLEAIIAAAQP